ncbi:MAG: hypothetical protein ACOC4A_02195, partial [Spirochaetota bacterium]
APTRALVAERRHPYTRHLYAAIPQLDPTRRITRSPYTQFAETPDPTVSPLSEGASGAQAGAAGADHAQRRGPAAARPGMEEVGPGHYVSVYFREESGAREAEDAGLSR